MTAKGSSLHRPLVARLVAVAAATCLGGCGSLGGPSDVPPWIPAGTVLTFTSGETGLPVSGASVAVGVTSYTTDLSGRITLRADIATSAQATLTVTHSAYLQRQTYLRTPADTSLTLWPASSPVGVYPEYTQKLVYSNDAPPDGTLPLRRLPPETTRVSVVPGPEIERDPEAMRVHRVAVERMTADTEGRVVYTLDTAPAATAVVRTAIRPDDPCAVSNGTCAYVNGDRITGAEIVFRTMRWAQNDSVVLHELGHTYGLRHSLRIEDMMGGDGWRRVAFSPAEVATMRLMWQRRPGNRWPDDDRAVGATTSSSAGRHTEVISCNFGGR